MPDRVRRDYGTASIPRPDCTRPRRRQNLIRPGRVTASRAAPMTAAATGRKLALSLTAVGAVGFSCHTVFARLSYEHGSSASTLLLVRAIVTVVTLYLLLRVRGVNPWLRGRALAFGLLLGLLLSGQAFSLFSAISFIPTGLAILVFYLYPMIVAVVSHVTGQKRASAVNAIALVIAFLGVALALGVTPGGLDWRGVVLAIVSAVLVSCNLLGSGIALRSADSVVITFTMALAMLAVFTVLALVRGTVDLPRDAAGWWPLAASVAAYLVASLSLYTSIQRAGPANAALIMNIEPISTITLAVALLGEQFTWMQLAGASLVIGAIFASRIADLRAARRAAPAAADGQAT
jgi:drug/metabolite transporter (DMT)-like permease